jgi:HAMP domain-containing protein
MASGTWRTKPPKKLHVNSVSSTNYGYEYRDEVGELRGEIGAIRQVSTPILKKP